MIYLPGLDIQGGSVVVFITPGVVGSKVVAESDITFSGPGMKNAENSRKNNNVTNWRR